MRIWLPKPLDPLPLPGIEIQSLYENDRKSHRVDKRQIPRTYLQTIIPRCPQRHNDAPGLPQ